MIDHKNRTTRFLGDKCVPYVGMSRKGQNMIEPAVALGQPVSLQPVMDVLVALGPDAAVLVLVLWMVHRTSVQVPRYVRSEDLTSYMKVVLVVFAVIFVFATGGVPQV